MCRHEHRYLCHDPISETRIRRKVGERFQRVHHDAGVLEPESALRAFVDVRAKIGNAETGFAVDQEVDLVGE